MLLPLNTLWCSYVSRLLASDPSAEPRTLLSADLHGATISVLRSRNPQHVGVGGIVCRTTAATLHVVETDDTLKGELPGQE